MTKQNDSRQNYRSHDDFNQNDLRQNVCRK